MTFWAVRSSYLQRCDVSQQTHELAGAEAWIPLITRVLIQAEPILLVDRPWLLST